jgi:hypothetical protein
MLTFSLYLAFTSSPTFLGTMRQNAYATQSRFVARALQGDNLISVDPRA